MYAEGVFVLLLQQINHQVENFITFIKFVEALKRLDDVKIE